MKKRICFLLLLLLCGCSASDAHIGERTRTLTIALWDYDQVSYDRSVVEAFEKLYPDVQVRVLSYPDTYYDQKAESLLMSGKQVDVVYLRTLASLKDLCAQRMMLPLDGFMDSGNFDANRYKDLEYMRYQGNTYAVPYRRDHYVLFYNCDLFDRAGVPYPEDGITWQEFRQLGLRLQQETGLADTYGIMILPMPIQWMASTQTYPLSYRNGDIQALTPGMNLLLGIQFEDGSAPLYGDCVAANVQQRQFETGRFSMYVGGTWFLNYLTSDQQAGRFRFQWGVCAQPRWEGQDPETLTTIPTGMGIGKNTADPALAWEFIRFAAGDAGARIMAKEQMLPAYNSDEMQQIFRDNFIGKSLSPGASDNQRGVCSGIPTDEEKQRELQLENLFTAIVTGQTTLDGLQ